MNHRLQKQNSNPSDRELANIASLPSAYPASAQRSASADIYQLIFEQAADGILVANSQGRCQEVNRQCCQMLGYTREELLQLSLADLLWSHDSTDTPLRPPSLPTNETVRTEVRLRHKHGTMLLVELRAQRLANDNMVACIRDITEQRRAEATLREMAENMAAAQQMAHFGSWEVKLTADSTYINPFLWSEECYRIFGFEPGTVEVTTEFYMSCVHPEDRTRLAEILRKNAHKGRGSAYEYRIIHPDGAIRHIHQQSIWIRDEHMGRPVKIIGTAHDITERKEAEAVLQSEQEKLNKIAATLPGIIYMFRQQANGTLKLHYISPGLTAVLGLSSEEIGEDIAQLFASIHPDDLPLLYATMTESAKDLSKQIVEYRVLTSDNGIVWMESIAVPEREADGSILWYGFITDITARKQAQEQLHYQANLLQNVTDAIIATDLDFRITNWNQGAERLYGWRAAEVMGKQLSAVIPTDYGHEQAPEVLQQFWQQEVWKGEVRQQTKQGAWLDIMSSVSVIKDSNGNVIGHVGVNRDISRRKRMEEALRQSEERFTKAFHASPAALSITHLPDHRFVDVNDSFVRMYGYSRDQLIGRRVADLQLFLKPGGGADLLRQLSTQGSVHNYEMTTRTKGGNLLHVLCSIETVELDGESNLLTTTFDITERKQAEERLKLALATTQMGVWEWEVEADKLFWSPECYTIFGTERFGNNRKSFATFVPPEDVDHVMAEFDIALANHTVYSSEFRIIRPDGEERWVYNLGRASYDKNGKPVRVLGIVQDTTERKQAEAAKAKLEEQLRQAQKMETIGRLAGGVAHDFNNLLTVIQGYSDLILMKMTNDDPLRSKLEQIQKAGKRATALTGQLLAFSRKQMLTPTVLDLNHLVTNLHAMLERLIGEDIDLTVMLQPGLWSVTADPSQIEQVMMNLVVNARDAMPTGGMLTIETANLYRDHRQLDSKLGAIDRAVNLTPCVMLAVTDTGCGMDEEIQAHMFEPFFTTKEPGKGTGLGLATVYGIIKQSGGDIFVYSEPGQGSTFKLYLPVNEVSIKHQAVALPHALPDQGCETILLVEDEEMVRKLVQVALEEKGYTLLEARAAGEALTLAAQYPGTINLLMTDVVMPQMSGRELAERLVVLRPDLKVLFTSGYTDDSVVRHGLLTAEVEFLPKPFSPHALALKVREVLDK